MGKAGRHWKVTKATRVYYTPAEHDIQLSEAFNKDSEYFRKMMDLIKERQLNPANTSTTHKHHIIPRSYFRKKGIPIDNNERQNIVVLRPAEHFMIHYYAWKCATPFTKRSMAGAFILMRKHMPSIDSLEMLTSEAERFEISQLKHVERDELTFRGLHYITVKELDAFSLFVDGAIQLGMPIYKNVLKTCFQDYCRRFNICFKQGYELLEGRYREHYSKPKPSKGEFYIPEIDSFVYTEDIEKEFGITLRNLQAMQYCYNGLHFELLTFHRSSELERYYNFMVWLLDLDDLDGSFKRLKEVLDRMVEINDR